MHAQGVFRSTIGLSCLIVLFYCTGRILKLTRLKRLTGVFFCILFAVSCVCTAYAASIPQQETPDYKIAFYAFDCYHMQDNDGHRYGYGYDMMQTIAHYMQCTFSYEGYDKTAAECVDMLRNGELDLYTAAKKTPEREEEFAFSSHPAITATTCMNVKVGNDKVITGDYSTYDGLRIGLLSRHTYNEKFEEFANQKGFSYEIIYYETPAELTNALINDEVDALVNSYISTPEDERTVETFGETPYYIMARKEDQALIDRIDTAIDTMNVEMPSWRTELYNKYYGAVSVNRDYTKEEKQFLSELQENQTIIRAVMNPDGIPYSWYENDEACGIDAEFFRKTAERLGLNYEIVPVADREEYLKLAASGDVDIWMGIDEAASEDSLQQYKSTDSYMSTTVSVLHRRGQSGKIKKLAILNNSVSVREILSANWPDAEVTVYDSLDKCVKSTLSGVTDGTLLMTYTAQKLAQNDIQNRLSVDIVPGAVMNLHMGVNANDRYYFYGLWNKALALTADEYGAEIVQTHAQSNADTRVLGYLFDHPSYFVVLLICIFLTLVFILLYIQSQRSRKGLQQISTALAAALEEAQDANETKQNFFSKMSHDIRTPLNVVLGMTQVAQKYKDDTPRLEHALENITTEGNYLLELINSILDVNQLEHGHIELLQEPFIPAQCLLQSAEVIRPLADRKEQNLTVQCDDTQEHVVIGDANRFKQIMINIITNAIKYTDVGGSIQLRMEYLPDNRYRFICSDTGIGMSEEFIKHISEDYVRAEDSRISRTEGTGLGMSVVK